MFNVKLDYPIKKAFYLPYHCYQGFQMRNQLKGGHGLRLFQLLNFTFDLFFNVKWGYLTTKALYLL